MDLEIMIVILASFVSGGAMGATGMLLCQWVVRKMSPPQQHRLGLMDAREVDDMKADVAELALRLHSVDARLDFTEQLLGGALHGARPPESLPTPLPRPPMPPAPDRASLDPDGEDSPQPGLPSSAE